ncbi:MAG: hypothetical protein ACKVOR_02275, partial [Flavobacteriales bacterium]
GAYDVLVYKVDAEGEVIWQQTYGGMDWDFGYKIIAHPDGGYLICGKTYSMGNGGSDGYLLHIDTEGNLISEWSYGGEGDDEFVDVETNDERIICGGNQYNGISNGFIMRLSQTMEIESTQYNSQSLDNVLSAICLSGDSIWYCGFVRTETFDEGFFKGIDSNLNVFRESQEEHEADNYYYGITFFENVLYLCGKSSAFGGGGFDGSTQLYDSDSFMIGPTFGEGGDEYLFDLLPINHQRTVSIGSNSSYDPLLTNQLSIFDYPSSEIAGLVPEIAENSCWVISVNEFHNSLEHAVYMRIHNLLGQIVYDGLTDVDIALIIPQHTGMLIVEYLDEKNVFLMSSKIMLN